MLMVVPWILVLLLAAAVAYLLWKDKKKGKQASNDLWSSTLVTDLREQVREMQDRYDNSVELFVNFPEVVKALTAALSVEEVTSHCSRGISSLLGSKNICIFVTRGQDNLLLADGVGFPPNLRGQYSCTITESDLLPVLEYRGISEIKNHPMAQAFLQSRQINVDIGLPLWYGGRLLGLIAISRPDYDKDMTNRVIAMLADLTAVSLNAAGLVGEIRKKAERDGLTGLANRRSLMTRVRGEVQRSRSYRSRVSLIMIDVDNFKHYNDRNGHGAGDEALKKVAAVMSSVIRKTDLVARYGGEEFTVLLPGADMDRAASTAERIRATVEANDFPHGEHQPLGRVSISLGVSTFPNNAADVASLFKAADTALYQAKEGGRNRVVLYSGPRLTSKEGEDKELDTGVFQVPPPKVVRK